MFPLMDSKYLFINDLYSLKELIPTAKKVNEEKIAHIMIVKFETSTSPSWYDCLLYTSDAADEEDV